MAKAKDYMVGMDPEFVAGIARGTRLLKAAIKEYRALGMQDDTVQEFVDLTLLETADDLVI